MGNVMIALGVVGILWGVLYVLEAANGPGRGPDRFQDRRSYDQVKRAVHTSLPGGLWRSALGLGLALGGGQIRRRKGSEPV
jgi:hypothetical protein